MIQVRKACLEDLPQISSIHKERFWDHFLGKYSKTLIKQFYKEFLSTEFVFLVAVDGDDICGFVLGGEEKKIDSAMTRFVKTNRRECIVETITRPQTWKGCFDKVYRKIRMLLRSCKKKKNNEKIKQTNNPPVSLLSIAVDNKFEKRGIGTMLVNEFDKKIFRTYSLYHLYVHRANYKAIEFYKKKGYMFDYIFRNGIAFIKCKDNN